MGGLGIRCEECKGELQDMTGQGEQPGWALCRCARDVWAKYHAEQTSVSDSEPALAE